MSISTGRIGDLKDSVPNITWGTARLRMPAQVYLHIAGAPEPVRIKLTRPIALGRAENEEAANIDINLMPYKAVEKGVSRRHLTLELVQETVSLTDLGSTNGTFLNGQKLQPFQRRIVRDGDEIRLGKLSIRIYF